MASAGFDGRLVVAIDFGTTYSGYAFGRKGDLEHVHLNKEWNNRLGLPSLKTATSVLTGRDGSLEAFGFDAEFKYSQLLERNDADGLDLFKNFKMLLHNEKDISRATTVCSTRGRERPAIEIFTMSLQFLKDHFLDAVNKIEGRVPEEGEIQWVITIPAIWSEKSKQFMREAAYRAKLMPDISSKQLRFALEPEAAALYCKAVELDNFNACSGHEVRDLSLTPGTKYIIIDAGGGTVDMTAQEVVNDWQVKELVAASGGGWGGNRINLKFEEMMKTVFGEDFIQHYKTQCTSSWMELQVQFEKKKRATQPDGESIISLPITRSLEKQYHRVTGNDIEDIVAKYKQLGISIVNDALLFDPTAVFDLFHSNFEFIIPHIEGLLKCPKLDGLKYIFLIGGFAESVFLQKAISTAFLPPQYTVLTPTGSSVAVLKGAVIFGFHPETVQSRIARKTYGHSIVLPFNESIHSPEHKILDKNNASYCCNIFDKHVTIGEEIQLGEVRKLHARPFDKDAKDVLISLFNTDKTDPQYVSEDGVNSLGELILDLNHLSKFDETFEIEIKVQFGATEILVEAIDPRPRGKSVKTTLEFLN